MDKFTSYWKPNLVKRGRGRGQMIEQDGNFYLAFPRPERFIPAPFGFYGRDEKKVEGKFPLPIHPSTLEAYSQVCEPEMFFQWVRSKSAGSDVPPCLQLTNPGALDALECDSAKRGSCARTVMRLQSPGQYADLEAAILGKPGPPKKTPSE